MIGISTAFPSAYSVTVSSPGAMRWPQNSRNGSGLVLSTFAHRRWFIGMPQLHLGIEPTKCCRPKLIHEE